METRVWSNLPYAIFPHPDDATYKIWSRLANWFHRYSSSKVWNFRHSRDSNSKRSGLIWPKIEVDQAFMPVLVTRNFDDDSIKNEQASMETAFSHCKSMGNILMHVLVTCKYKKGLDQKQPRKGRDTILPIINQWGFSVAMDTRVLIQSGSKHYEAFPHPQWCYSKIWSRLASWPQSYSSSKVQKFRHSRASNSKVIRPEIKLVRAFMPALVTSNFDDDSIIMNELARRQHFPIISLWEFF